MKNLVANWKSDTEFRSDARRLAVLAAFWLIVAVAAFSLYRIGFIVLWSVKGN